MSRITKVGRSQVAGAVKDAFETIAKARGNIPNMYRVMAHQPAMLETLHRHFAEVMKATTLSVKFKELLALATSIANACRY
jgi:alkylhydroperoxidase family enzyme